MVGVVQAAGTWDDSGDTQTSFGLAFDSNVTAGNKLLAACRFQQDITPTIADTLGNTWNLVRRVWNAGEGLGGILYECVSPSGGANTVTFSFSTANAQTRLAVVEVEDFDGGESYNAEAAVSQFFSDDSTDAVSSGNLTTDVNGALIVGIFFSNGGLLIAAGTGYTEQAGSTAIRTWVESRIQASLGTIAATWTLPTGQSTLGVAMAVAIAPSGGGGGSTILPQMMSQYYG